MNLAKNRTLHPQLRDEEIVLVENAIRLAIDSIINVLYGVNSARTHEYQRMVADRDKEIQRLECRLGEIEHELQVLRRQGCTCERLRSEHSLSGSQDSGDRQLGEQSGFEPDCMDAEMTAGQQECEMSISCEYTSTRLTGLYKGWREDAEEVDEISEVSSCFVLYVMFQWRIIEISPEILRV